MVQPGARVMVDSGAYYSVCPRSFAAGAPREEIGDELNLVTVTGERIDIDERRTVTTTGRDASGRPFEQTARYLVGNVRKPVRSVADIIDGSGYEVHFGKTSWMAPGRTPVPPNAIMLERVENQFYDMSSLASPDVGDVDEDQGDTDEVPGGGPLTEVDRDSAERRGAVAIRRPALPSEQEQMDHKLRGHVPFAAWCFQCVAGRAQDEPHVRRAQLRTTLMIVVAFDYGFLDDARVPRAARLEDEGLPATHKAGTEQVEQSDSCVPFLSMMDTSSGLMAPRWCGRKVPTSTASRPAWRS